MGQILKFRFFLLTLVQGGPSEPIVINGVMGPLYNDYIMAENEVATGVSLPK